GAVPALGWRLVAAGQRHPDAAVPGGFGKYHQRDRRGVRDCPAGAADAAAPHSTAGPDRRSRGRPPVKGLLAKFTVKPLLWACGLLLAAAAVLGGLLYTARADVATAEARAGVAAATAGQRATERDAWKQAAQASAAAAGSWQAAFATMRTLLRN